MLARLRERWPFVALVLWLGASGGVMGAMWAYAQTPGASGAAPAWVVLPGVSLSDDRPTLIMFAHPRCPCTRASMEELARLQRRTGLAFETLVLFVEPREGAEDWRTGDLWSSARRLPSASALADPGGDLSRGAGAMTSGAVALVAPGGRVLFWGGITASRGHAGASPGAEAIVGILERGEAWEGARTSPVYGCPLGDFGGVCGPDACDAGASGDGASVGVEVGCG